MNRKENLKWMNAFFMGLCILMIMVCVLAFGFTVEKMYDEASWTVTTKKSPVVDTLVSIENGVADTAYRYTFPPKKP